MSNYHQTKKYVWLNTVDMSVRNVLIYSNVIIGRLGAAEVNEEH